MDYPNNAGYGNSPGRRIDFGFPNDGFQPPANPPPFASTPTISRAPRPRFAYSGPSNYPRPGSSAAKPNPSSFSELMRSRYVPMDDPSDSMINNYGDSESNMDVSYLPDRSFVSDYSSHSDSMDSSVYYSCNESLNISPQKKFSLLAPPYMQQAAAGRFGSQSTLVSSQTKQFKATSGARFKHKPKPYTKPQPPGKKSDWRCELCNIDFTSRVPFAMHFQGQKHAKKLKLKEALKSIQSQVKGNDVVTVGSLFRCDICGTVANSSFQLQTHLDGLKHKAKVAQLAIEERKKNQKEKRSAKETNKPDANPGEKSDNANQNGSKKKGPKEKSVPFSVLPTNVSSVEMQKPPKPPLAKAAQTIFTCVICDVTLNSELQHQQHMLGKFHKAKAEGKPVPWKKNKPNKTLVQQYKEKLKKDAEGKTELLTADKEAAESTTEQLTPEEEAAESTTEKETAGTPEVGHSNEPVVDCMIEPMEQVETAKEVETSIVTNPVEQAAKKTKPLTGILKNKNPASEKVMGVKSLQSSFVKGDVLK